MGAQHDEDMIPGSFDFDPSALVNDLFRDSEGRSGLFTKS